MATTVPNLSFVQCRNKSGVSVLLPNAAMLATSDFGVDVVFVECENAIGLEVDMPNSAIYSKRFVPQPFLNALSNPTVWGTFFFAPGYVDHYYREQWFLENVTQPVVFSLDSGALPPGLVLSTIGITARGQIAGTPTDAGLYNFVLRAVGPDAEDTKSFTISITEDDAPPPRPRGTAYVSGN